MQRNASALIVGLLLCAGTARAESPATMPAATEALIQQAIRDLESGSYKVRQRASLQLWDIGSAALPALRIAAASSAMEVRARVQDILGNITLGITPRTDKNVADLVRLYRTSPPGSRRASAYQLLELGHKADEIVLRLADADATPEMRLYLVDGLAQRAGIRAAGAIADNQLDRAQQILSGVWTSGYDSPWRDAAALALQTDRIPAAIAAIPQSPRGETDEERIWRVTQLAYLHRAAGDLPAAIVDLKGTNNPLIDSLGIEAGTWTMLHTDGYVKRTLCEVLSGGDDAAMQKAVADIELRVLGIKSADVVKLYLLTGSPGNAVAFAAGKPDREINLSVAQDAPAAFDILRLLGRYDEALALASREGTAPLFIEAIKLRIALGQKKEARTLVDAQMQKWGPHSAADGSAGIQLRLLVGPESDALTIAGRMIDANRGDLDVPLKALFADKLDDATFWFRIMQPIDGSSTLPRLYALFKGRMPREDASKYLPAALGVALQVPTPYMAGAPSVEAKLASVAQGLMCDHLDAEAADVLEKNPVSQESFDALMLAAQRARAQGDFTRAARLYHRAWEPDPLDPNPMFREGESWWQAGETKRGQELMDRALMVPLGDGDRRIDLITALGALGKTALARRQMAILLRTCDPQSTQINVVLQWLLRHRDIKETLEVREKWAQRFMAAQGTDNPASAATAIGDAVSSAIEARQFFDAVRIEKLVAAGKVDAAIAQAKVDLERWPLGDEYVVPVIRALDRAGHRVDGDALYQSVAAAHQKILATYPDAAEIHNNIAWIAAETGRDLDAGLTHATRATALKPDDGTLWNTLAEVHGARGERVEAIEANRKALTLIPEQADFVLDMQSFEQLRPSTAPRDEQAATRSK